MVSIEFSDFLQRCLPILTRFIPRFITISIIIVNGLLLKTYVFESFAGL